MNQHRVMALVQSGALQVNEPFGPTAIFQPGLYPMGSLAAQLHPTPVLTMEALSHLRPEDQAAAAMLAAQQQAQAQAHAQGQLPHFLPPGIMEQLVAQQQQQQQQHAMASAAVAAAAAQNVVNIPSTPENLLEVQRQYEALVFAVQKNPATLAQNPQISLIIEQYRRILQEAHIQQQRMHEAMTQHELHKRLFGRVPGTPHSDENASTRGIRTGVIVQPN